MHIIHKADMTKSEVKETTLARLWKVKREFVVYKRGKNSFMTSVPL